MKKLLMMMTLMTAVTAQANCIPTYQEKLADIDAEISQRQNDESFIVKASKNPLGGGATFLVGGLTGIEVANAAGTSIYGAGGSTAGATGAIVAMGVSAVIVYNLKDANIPELRSSSNATSYALSLLREADAGGGVNLRMAMNSVVNNGNSGISQNQLAQKITELSDRNEFCSTDELDNYSTILSKAVNELK
jgi:hypothetical protein